MDAAVITFPTDGATGVANQPDFTWQGPAGWQGALHVNDVTNDSLGDDHLQAQATLSGAQTSWIPSVTLPAGTNRLDVDYQSNATALIVATVPMAGSQPISTWTSTATLETWAVSDFTVSAPPTPTPWTQGHRLIALYPFNQAAYGWFSASDVSANNNSFAAAPRGETPGTHSIARRGLRGAARCSSTAGSASRKGSSPGSQSFDNWLATFYGSFSVSLWINTTTVVGNMTTMPSPATKGPPSFGPMTKESTTRFQSCSPAQGGFFHRGSDRRQRRYAAFDKRCHHRKLGPYRRDPRPADRPEGDLHQRPAGLDGCGNDE